MDVRDTARHCHSCGCRLARDNRKAQCTPCQVRARRRFCGPPELPADFWDDDQLRDALGSWHIGRVIHAYRQHPVHGPRPLPQELVASWLDLTQAQLSRVESGRPVTDLARLTCWARILGIPADRLWFTLPEERGISVAARRREETTLQAASALPLPAPAPSPPMALIPLAVSSALRDPDAAAIEGFRSADRQVGGGHLYPAVTGYLHTAVAPRLFGMRATAEGVGLFAAACSLTEMAGWMAHDAGHDSTADRHFHRSLDLAALGGDVQLEAHVYASLSHLCLHLDEPKAAMRHAQRGHAALAGSRAPDVSARLLAMEARGLAALGEPAACGKALLRAERVIEQTAADEPSPWVSRFDAGSLASEAARCMRRLGHLEEAERHARQIIELRAGTHMRSRALGQLMLAAVLVAQGKPDEACAIARDVLNATRSLSSHVVSEQLRELHTLLRPYRTVTVVAEFLPHLAETVSERLGWYRWLTTDAAS